MIRNTYIVAAPVQKVWRALVDPEEIAGWGAGPAVMSEQKDVEFKLWGGDIYGRNTQVVKNKKITQDWYAGDWKHPSKVTIELASQQDKTKVTLHQENVPEDEFKEINDGWDRYYFGEIKKYLED
ncbi:MAG: SRPBCC domain-containing protein [Candidatus Woykebacteria bacterium]